MATNTLPLQPLTASGWRRGFRSLLRKENHLWWGTRRWWIQCLIWLVVLNGTLVIALWVDPETMAASVDASKAVTGGLLAFSTVTGFFAALGLIVMAQSELIGEKQLGTAAWIPSKPVSRSAFILSKLAAYSIGLGVTIIGLQGLVAYGLTSIRAGALQPVAGFVGGMGLLALYLLFYLTLTLMLGTLFNSRNPVIGLALVVVFANMQLIQLNVGTTFLPGMLPNLAAYLMVTGSVPTVVPILVTAALCVIFGGVAIWRFGREEF